MPASAYERVSAYVRECVEFDKEVKREFEKASVSRAVRVRECPLAESWLYSRILRFNFRLYTLLIGNKRRTTKSIKYPHKRLLTFVWFISLHYHLWGRRVFLEERFTAKFSSERCPESVHKCISLFSFFLSFTYLILFCLYSLDFFLSLFEGFQWGGGFY